LPSTLTPPARADVEWLDPQVHETLGPQQGDRWGGKRAFAFVVRVRKEGKIDLGELALPYWDSDTRRYETARVALGSINVKPGAAPAPSADASQDVLAGLPPMRAERTPAVAASRHFADSAVFWLGLLASPLAYAAVVGARGAARRVRERREAKAASPLTELRARVAVANAASKKEDGRALDAAVARVIEAATIAHASVNVRGALADEVTSKLEAAGVANDVAREVDAILRECEASRFAPDESSLELAKARWKRARAAIEKLEART
jgi:hypothetical protein